MDSINDFATWQFWVACLFVSAAIWFSKTIVGHLSPATLDKGWWKALLTTSNLGWGLVAAIPDNFLKGDTEGARMMLGVGVGFFSHFAYHLVFKRFADKFGVNPPGLGSEAPSTERQTDKERPAAGGP